MRIRFKQAKYISIGIMLGMIILVSFIPWIFYLKISPSLYSFFGALSNVEQSVEIMHLFNSAGEDLEEMVKEGINKSNEIDKKIERMINLSQSLARDNADKRSIKEQADQFVKNAKHFKRAVYYYTNEIKVDPSSDNAIQMEEIAIETKNKSTDALFLFVNDIGKEAGEQVKFTENILNTARPISIISLLACIFLGIMAILLMAKALSKPLEELILGTNKIADGNLDFRVTIHDKDEIGKLAQSFNHMAQKLKLAGEHLQNIIDSMPFMLLCVDLNGELRLLNKTASQITGYSNTNGDHKKLWEIIPQFEPEKQRLLQTLAQKKIGNLRRYKVVVDSKESYFDITIYPLQTSAEVGAAVVIQNVTSAVRMENLMVQSEKMLSVGGLSAGMAHEINNPLAGIMQNVQVVINRLTKELPGNEKAAREAGITMPAVTNYMERREILRFLDNILKSGSHAATIVESMLSFAKQGSSAKSGYDTSELISKVLELANNDYNLKKKYDFRQIKIINTVTPDFPKILCEDNKIIQVLFNIVKNATEAMHYSVPRPEDPTLIFRLMSVNNMAQIEIEDNGPGMDEPTRKRIFEPFFTTKDVSEGTGLGLSLSYFIIVDDHNGELRVESQPGKGTTFFICLPMEEKEV